MRSNSARELSQLVRSLSPHEKRYFKLFANFSGKRTQNNYLHLFSLLQNMDPYSDEALEEQVAGSAYEGHLPSTVFHLNQLVLRCLKSFHANATEHSRLREQLDFARILYEKAQFPAALRMLRRIRKKSEALEATLILLEALQLEKELLFRTQSHQLYEEIGESAEREQELLDGLKTEFTLSSLAYKHKALRLQKFDVRQSRDQARFREIMSHPLLQGPAPDQGWVARRHWFGLQGAQALLQRDFEATYRHFGEILRDLEARPRILKEWPGEYIRHLTDYLNACIYSKRWIEADQVMQRLSGVEVRTAEEELSLLNLSAYTQLFYCLNTGRYEAGLGVVQQIRSLLELHEKSVPVNRRLTYYYNITIFFFLHEEYSQALRWLNHILQFPPSDLRRNLQDFARIFQLVLHYELGNHDLVEYLFRSTYRYYLNRSGKDGEEETGPLQDFEAVLFHYFRQIFFTDAPIGELAGGLYEALWELARNPRGREPAGLYELIFWVQSKVEGIPLKEVYRERVAARMALVEEVEKGGEEAVIRALEQRETE